jgi:uncharacterized protein YjiS (DUF1127 family)
MSCAHKTYSSSIVGSVPTNPAKSHRSRAYSLGYWIEVAVWCRERRRQRKALLQLDDRMLADIGISRSQAIGEARKPFWK